VLWLANLSGDNQRLKINGFDSPARLHVLDERSFEAAARDPAWLGSGATVIRKVASLELPPYGVARIQGG
jgi:hypothetical protein